MKIYRALLFILSLLFFSTGLKASHTYGGELSWECLPNGKYQFNMTFYRDCTGIPWAYHDESIEIVGSPLPTDGNGTMVSSILLKPDSALWTAQNFGDFAPTCTGQYGSPFKCSDGGPNANGIVQRFFLSIRSYYFRWYPSNNRLDVFLGKCLLQTRWLGKCIYQWC